MLIKTPPCYDVSHWKEIADFSRVVPRPLLFITKATEATTFVDPKFVRFFAGMAGIGVRRGCFHFHRKAYQAVDQAAHFCNTVRARITEDDILILDVEEGGETAAQLKAWLEYVRSQYPKNQLMLYSRKNILDPIPMFMRSLFPGLEGKLVRPALNAIEMTLAEREFFSQIPTWTAGYPANPDSFTSVPSYYVPDQTKFGPVWLWQYSDKGTVAGIEGSVDLNWIDPFFAALLEEGTVPPGDEMKKYQVIWRNGVARRSAPTTSNSGTSQPAYPFDAVVDVVQDNIPDQTSPLDVNKTWVKFADGYYGASNYPDGSGPQVRMIDVTPPPVTTLPEIHLTSAGNDYYPAFDYTVKPK